MQTLPSFGSIRDYPTDIYRHALPFCPSSSCLHKWYTPESLRQVKVVKGRSDEWGRCTREVFFRHEPATLMRWKDFIAVGLTSGEVAVSLDGALLVSGDLDGTIKPWDIQTGGMVRISHQSASSVAILPDATTVASGSSREICLWDIGTGKCNRTINITPAPCGVTSLHFLSSIPEHLVSVSGGFVQQWDTDGYETGPTIFGFRVAFSSDGERFVPCNDGVLTVYNTASGTIIDTLHSPGRLFIFHCFSPSGEFVAGVADASVCVWNVTNTPHLIEACTPHGSILSFLVYSFSLISMHDDRKIRFRRIGGDPPDLTSRDTQLPAGPPRAEVVHTTLQAEEGVAISVDSIGIIECWDLESTGVGRSIPICCLRDWGILDSGFCSYGPVVTSGVPRWHPSYDYIHLCNSTILAHLVSQYGWNYSTVNYHYTFVLNQMPPREFWRHASCWDAKPNTSKGQKKTLIIHPHHRYHSLDTNSYKSL